MDTINIQTQKEEKIRLEGMYPYTYVRVNVMRTKLLNKHDYDKLLKMSFSEIAKFLQDTEYKSEIDELAMKYNGVELLEIALLKNLVKSFRKLKKISSAELNKLIDIYLSKYDLINIKTLVRGIYTKTDKSYLSKLLIPAGKLNEEILLELIKKDSVDELIKAVAVFDSGFEYKPFQKYIEALKEKGELHELENALDKYHNQKILDFIERLFGEGDLFRKFLLSQIETLNILTVVRLLKEGLNKDEIKKFIFWTGHREYDHLVHKFIDAKHIENVLDHITNKSTKKIYGKCIEVYKEKKSLTEFERMLSKSMLERAILFVHQHPLSINTILGYMFAKEIEIQNLLKLIKGKELGLDEKFIESEIVV